MTTNLESHIPGLLDLLLDEEILFFHWLWLCSSDGKAQVLDIQDTFFVDVGVDGEGCFCICGLLGVVVCFCLVAILILRSLEFVDDVSTLGLVDDIFLADIAVLTIIIILSSKSFEIVEDVGFFDHGATFDDLSSSTGGHDLVVVAFEETWA